MPHAISFDTRARTLTDPIDPDYDLKIVAQHEQNRRRARTGAIHEYGNADHDRKIEDCGEPGSAPWSMLDQHTTCSWPKSGTSVASAPTTRIWWGRVPLGSAS